MQHNREHYTNDRAKIASSHRELFNAAMLVWMDTPIAESVSSQPVDGKQTEVGSPVHGAEHEAAPNHVYIERKGTVKDYATGTGNAFKAEDWFWKYRTVWFVCVCLLSAALCVCVCVCK